MSACSLDGLKHKLGKTHKKGEKKQWYQKASPSPSCYHLIIICVIYLSYMEKKLLRNP